MRTFRLVLNLPFELLAIVGDGLILVCNSYHRWWDKRVLDVINVPKYRKD